MTYDDLFNLFLTEKPQGRSNRKVKAVCPQCKEPFLLNINAKDPRCLMCSGHIAERKGRYKQKHNEYMKTYMQTHRTKQNENQKARRKASKVQGAICQQ